MKMGEAEKWLRQQLQKNYGESESSNIAAMVMEHVTGYNRLQRMAKKEEAIQKQQSHLFNEIAQRLQNQEPVQYVLGEAYFGTLKLFVDKSVLIPRPETEELVHWITEDVKASGKEVFQQTGTDADKTNVLKILDIGTGSGCIALLLKHGMPLAEVWGCDASDAALTIARRNGSELDIRVDFVGLNFLDAAQWLQLPTVDVLVSNPPYIPLKDKATMQPNVVAHEPHLALFVPDDDALVFYNALAQFGKERLYPGGAIYVETHEEKAGAVAALFEKEGYSNIVIKKDMQGKERMVKAEKL